MKVTINIEIDNPDDLKAVSGALANMHEVNAKTATTKKTEVVKCKPQAVATEESYDREALEAQAKELGVPFRSNISDKSLKIKIDNHIKANPSKNTDTKESIAQAMPSTPEEQENDEEELRQRINASKKESTDEQEEEPQEEETAVEEDTDEQEESPEPEEDSSDEEESEDDEEDDPLKSALKRKRKPAISKKSRKIKKVNWD